MTDPKAVDSKNAARPGDVSEVVYIPLDPGDPHETKAFGQYGGGGQDTQ